MRAGLWVLWAVVGVGSVAFAGRPLETNDADPVDKGHFELEAAVGYVHDGSDHHFDFPLALTYGLIDRLEVGIEFGGQTEERKEITGDTDTASGIGDLIVAAKYKLLDQRQNLPSQALAAAVKFPTADEDKALGSGELDYDITWIASYAFNEQWAGHVNVGYTCFGNSDDEDFSNVLYYSVAITYALSETLQPVAEVIAETPMEDDGPTVVGSKVGLCWSLNDAVTLDAAVGTRLVNDWPDLTATCGLTWAF